MRDRGFDPPAYYRQAGPSSYTPTKHAQGAWAPDQQHMGPVSGLLAHVIETTEPRADLALSRVSFDILGVIPLSEVEVTARVSRPGRTVELVEAVMSADGRALVRAHAWRLLRTDTESIEGTDLAPLRPLDEATPWPGTGTWSGGFIESLDIRMLPGGRPGRGQVWLRSTVDVLEGFDVGALPRFFAVFDTMNGVAVRVRPETVAFPNTDLTVHLFRQPAGEWLGLDVEVSVGPGGAGLTSAVLHDAAGPFGRAMQILTLRPLVEMPIRSC